MTALLSTLPASPRVHDRFNTVSCLAIGAAIVAYCVAEPAPLLAAVALPVLGLGWWLARSGSPPVLPRMVVNALVLVAIARAFLLVRGSGDPVVSHLSEFLVFIQLIKLYDRRAVRDEAQMLSLSLFIVIGALLTSNSLEVGVLLLVYTPLATAAAMLLQIRGGLTRARSADPTRQPTRATTVFAPDLARPGPRRRAARRHFLGVVATAIVLSFAFAAVVFLLTPRGLGRDNFGRLGQNQGAAAIGFNDQVRLGDSGFLDGDATPVMDVVVYDERGERLAADGRSLHLRGAVLDAYDPRQRLWRPPWGRRGGDGGQSVHPGERHALAPPAGGRLVQRIEVTVREPFANRTGYIFTVWAPTAIEFPTRESISRPNAAYTLRRVHHDGGGRLKYTVWADLEGAAAADPAFRRSRAEETFAARSEAFRSGPVHELAVRLVREAGLPLDPAEREQGDNRAVAGLFQSHLRQNYEYTLDMVAPRTGQDPLEMFLFETRRGHCEYFASALVAMCHAVGIDARLVTGYLATEFNPVTGQYLVRQSNAHAWAEVNIAAAAGAEDADGDEGEGGEGGARMGRWITMDPSPPGALDRIHRPRTGVMARLRQFYNAVDFAWNDKVVAFDDRRRSDLFQSLLGGSDGTAAAARGARELADRVGAWFTMPGSTTSLGQWLILIGLGAIAASGLFLTPALLRRLHISRRRGSSAKADPQLRRLLAGAVFYERALRALERAGVGKPDSRPPLAHAAAMKATHPEAAGVFRSLAMLYYRPRFARVALNAEEAAEAERLLRELGTALTPRAGGVERGEGGGSSR